MYPLVLGIDSEFCNVEALVTGIVDNWPDKLLKHRRLFTGTGGPHKLTLTSLTFEKFLDNKIFDIFAILNHSAGNM